MIQIIRAFFWLQLVALTTICICAPIKDQMGNVQIVYHVGDIAEHAYNADTWNNNNNQPNPLPRIPTLPQVPLNSATVLGQQSKNSSSSISSSISSSSSSSSSSSQSQQTNDVLRGHRVSSTEATIGLNLASGVTTTNNPINKGITSAPSSDATARSLESFLVMLEETRKKDSQTGIPQQHQPHVGTPLQTPSVQLQQQQNVDVQQHSDISPETTGLQLQQPNPQLQLSHSQLQQPNPPLQQPSPPLQQPSPQLQQPSPQLQQPSPQLQQPSPQLQQPSPQLQQPSPQLQHPSPQLQHPSPQLQHPSPQLQHPSPQLQHPSPQLQHPSPQLQQPSLPLQQPNQQLQQSQSPVIQLQQPNSQQLQGQPPNPLQPQEWAVYDDLDTQESNQTAVIASNQKFGYVVHGNNYKRFRVEEKAANGLITGQFGVQHNNGRFRGVQYVADPANVNPKVLYDALVKFLSL